MTATLTTATETAAFRCASWCTLVHDHNDPSDRVCSGAYRTVPLPLEETVEVLAPGGTALVLDEQRVVLERDRDGLTQVVLSRGDDSATALTVDGARALRDHLTALLREAGVEPR